MKKLFVMIAFGFMLAFAACSNSNQEATDKATADSVANGYVDSTTLSPADTLVIE